MSEHHTRTVIDFGPMLRDLGCGPLAALLIVAIVAGCIAQSLLYGH